MKVKLKALEAAVSNIEQVFMQLENFLGVINDRQTSLRSNRQCHVDSTRHFKEDEEKIMA